MMPKHDHTAILQTVRQELPPEELICDLSDLFKVFGDTTRSGFCIRCLNRSCVSVPSRSCWA